MFVGNYIEGCESEWELDVCCQLDGEGITMYDVVVGLEDAIVKFEVAIDGGKNSLSMIV
jgi:hypothetical protein